MLNQNINNTNISNVIDSITKDMLNDNVPISNEISSSQIPLNNPMISKIPSQIPQIPQQIPINNPMISPNPLQNP